MASDFSAAIWFGLIPVLIFAASALVCFSHAMNPRVLSTGSRSVFGVLFWARRPFLIPWCSRFCCRSFGFPPGRRDPVRVHLGPRDSAAFSLRSTDALRLDLHVPVALINLFITGLLVAPVP
jgi:hypothetical protein